MKKNAKMHSMRAKQNDATMPITTGRQVLRRQLLTALERDNSVLSFVVATLHTESGDASSMSEVQKKLVDAICDYLGADRTRIRSMALDLVALAQTFQTDIDALNVFDRPLS